MAIFKTTFITALMGLMLLGQAVEGMGAQQERGERGRRGCRGSDRIKIQDLDVSPDPLVEGQRIRAWKVRIRLEGKRECDTEVEVREGRELVGRERRYTLQPGINEIDIQPVERYRFSGREHCFTVIADLEGTKRQVDADRRFCAYQKPAWSMSERGDGRDYNRGNGRGYYR